MKLAMLSISSLVVQSLSCVRLCDLMESSTTVLLHYLKLMSIESVTPSNRLILCHPLLLLPSVFPSIRVFSSELALHVGWSKYWSFSFSISPSSDYSGLISTTVLVLVARPTARCVRCFHFHTGSPLHLSMHPSPVSLMC